MEGESSLIANMNAPCLCGCKGRREGEREGKRQRETERSKLDGMEQSNFGDAKRALIRTLYSPPLRQAAASLFKVLAR